MLWIVWAALAFELPVKTYLAPNRQRYLLTHWMDVICVAVPFLRPLRLLRLLVVGIRLWTEARTVLRERTFGFIGTALDGR
jgi:voltage-gated potassium channel